MPIFLPTARNAFGMIGPVDWDAGRDPACASRSARTRMRDKRQAMRPRPFRLACIQLCTYDGTVYNVGKVLERITTCATTCQGTRPGSVTTPSTALFDHYSPMRL